MRKSPEPMAAPTSTRGSRASHRWPRRRPALAAALLWATLAPAARAQEYQLFDKLSVALGGGWNAVDTIVRLDSKELGIGTELSFEDDLDLDSSKLIPDLTVAWRLGRRHLLTFFWNDIDRDQTSRVTGEIRFGDLVVPVAADVTSVFDIQTYLVGYNYYPIVKDRVAFGVGGGLRVLDILASIRIEGTGEGDPPGGDFEEADVVGPFPFIGVEVRYGLSRKWRLISGLGLFSLEVGDLDGSQGILSVQVENLVSRHFSWGFDTNVSVVDVTVDDDDFLGTADLDLSRIGFFVKARW